MNKNLLKIGVIILVVIPGGIFLWPSADEKSPLDRVETTVENESAFKIIAFGDSLTAGYGLSASQAYPAQLESVLLREGYDVSIINSGVSGETSRGNLERANFIASQDADMVILGIGGNDALRRLSVAETKNNIIETVQILKQAKAGKSEIVLLKMQAPINVGLVYKKQFDDMYEDIADEEDLILAPFITAELFLDSSNKLPDGIHYNQKGYAKAVDLYIAPAVREILEV